MDSIASLANLDFSSMLQKGMNEGSALICKNMLAQLEETIKKKDTRLTQMEQIYIQNLNAKEKELLSERKRLALLKEFISKHTKCVGCEKKFDSLLHIPYVLTCGHTVCSLCFFNIPIITDDEKQKYETYKKEAEPQPSQPSPPAPPSLQRHDSGGFLSTATKSLFEYIVGDDDPAKRERFMRSYQEKVRQIEEQQKHLQGFEHIGKCPVCKKPQRGLRYDLLATFNSVKEFSFGKNSKNKKNKRKSIKKSNKRKSNKRKSIKRKSSKRKSNKRKSKRKSIKNRNKK